MFCIRTYLLHYYIILRANPAMEEGKLSVSFLESIYFFEIGSLSQLRSFSSNSWGYSSENYPI
jgi:hypothetical protein